MKGKFAPLLWLFLNLLLVDAAAQPSMSYPEGEAGNSNGGLVNTSVGLGAGGSVTGNLNTFYSYNAGGLTTSGTENLMIGAYAGLNNVTGNYNFFVGFQAGFLSTTSNNHFAGYKAGYSNTTGNLNYFSGNQAGYWNTTGRRNYFSAYQAGYNNTTGGDNCYIGYRSGYFNTTGSNNVAVGGSSGNSFPNLNNCVFIGEDADALTDSLTNAGAIGYQAKVNINDGLVLGNTTTNIGIRQNSPVYPLHVNAAYSDGYSWYNASDATLKENFQSIADEGILEKVMQLTIERWNYIGEQPAATHVGPSAQNFNQIFELGGNERAISTVDEAGVALAAIQELNRAVQELRQQVAVQQQQIEILLATSQVQTGNREAVVHAESDIILEQNNPNPFHIDTEIGATISPNVKHATFFIFNMEGKLVQKRVIEERGKVSIHVPGGSLLPGMYLYSLVGDTGNGQINRMVLTK